MHKYLQKSDEELLDILVQNIATYNPKIKIGENIGLAETVYKGKVVNVTEWIDPSTEILNLDFTIPHEVPPHEVVISQSIKVRFADIEKPEWNSFQFQYLYPCSLTVPHREWMMKHKPGDTVLVRDESFAGSPLVLTEEHFKQHEYLIFRFGASN